MLIYWALLMDFTLLSMRISAFVLAGKGWKAGEAAGSILYMKSIAGRTHVFFLVYIYIYEYLYGKNHIGKPSVFFFWGGEEPHWETKWASGHKGRGNRMSYFDVGSRWN